MNLSRMISIPSLPLLAKDLIEMSARKRTYAIRALAAAALVLIGMLATADELRYRDHLGPLRMLGAGKQMVEAVIICLMVGVYLLLPAVMCPAIASERASGTLTLLRVSPLRPWQIVLQKYIARLIPVVSLVLLAMPMMGVAYLFGGLEADVVYRSAYVVLLAALQVAAVTLMCSAYFRSPGGAFIASYVVLGLISWLWPGLVWEFDYSVGLGWREAAPIAAMFCPPLLLEDALYRGAWTMNYGVLPHIGIWSSIVGSLILARVFLVTRADAKHRNLLLKLFRALDAMFKKANAITGHKNIVADRRSLPEDEPVAWSELHRRAIGKVQYLFRFFVALEIPAALIALIVVYAGTFSYGYRRQFEELSAILLIAWVAYAIILTILAAGLFESERGRQTLDVLLTTPVRTRDLVRQKLAGLNRFRIVLLMPIATLVLVQGWAEWEAGGLQYVIVSGVALWVYPSLAIWIALWIGLRCRKPARALLVSLVVNTAIALGPVLVGAAIAILTRDDEPGIQIAFVGPVMLLATNEFNIIDEVFDAALPAALVQLGFWAIICACVRAAVMGSADRMLGRVAASPTVNPPATGIAEPA